MACAFGVPPLIPRNGHTLVVAIIARISGCTNQKELSLEDQVDNAKELVTSLYDGPVKYEIISTKAKGERLDRPELAVIERAFRSGVFDVAVLDDLGRLVRGVTASRFVGIAVDHGTRVITPNDSLDTANENWEEAAVSACRDHISHNVQTSKRLKQKLMNRFRKFGGAPARPIAGYEIPDGVKTYDGWKRRDEDTAIIREGKDRLQRTMNCSEVADLFNSRGFLPGPYCRLKKWDGEMVRRYFSNSLLKGMPGRGHHTSVKHHESGRRIATRNPEGPTYYPCPHLAHLDPAEFDHLKATLDARNANRGRKKLNGEDLLYRVPRKRTRFPGQLARCWYCGRECVWGGNGKKFEMMCTGARRWQCWNSVAFSGSTLATRIFEFLTAELCQLHNFDNQFRELVKAAGSDGGREQQLKRAQLAKEEAELNQKKENVKKAMIERGDHPIIKELLAEFEDTQQRVARDRWELEQSCRQILQLPSSTIELRDSLQMAIADLAIDSADFADLMRQLVPSIEMYLVRLCDGGYLLPRARVTLALDGIIPGAESVPELSNLMSRVFTVDLFTPPQREQFREQAVGLASTGLGPGAIALSLPEKPTGTAIQRALALDGLMRQRGLSTPYELVLDPPEDRVLRRHRHPRYRFLMQDGYIRSQL